MFQNIYIDRTDEGQIVHLWDDKIGHTEFAFNDFSYAYKVHKDGTIPSLLGPLTKKVYRFSREDPLILESDLPRETRVLTDLYLDSDEPAEGNRLIIFDIEVDDSEGLPNIHIADKEITSIALEDRVTGEEYVFILDHDGELDHVDDGFDDVIIFNAHSEEELLSDFLDIWEQLAPTIITGWNIDYFDVPYLCRRIERVLGYDEVTRLSPVGLIRFMDRRGKFQIAGVAALDYLDLYKKFTYTEQPNYRLDTIGKAEVDQGKYVYEEATLDELRKNNLEGFLEYNLDDVRIVSMLDKKMKLIQLVIGICTVGHVPYEDYTFSSRWLEGALVTDLHRKGIVCPNKSLNAQAEMADKDKSGTKGFTGAYVKEPKSGRHEWVFSLDLQSLYPSIIMSLNISPETKIGKVVDWDLAEYIRGEAEEYILEDMQGERNPISRERLISSIKKNNFSISSNGVLYRNDKVGIIPETLSRWFAERIEYIKERDDAKRAGDDEKAEYFGMRQHIQKIFLNSLYGVLGLPIFRFYDVDNALAVTATGQDVIKTSAKYVNAHYNKELKTEGEDYCIYIDTDSVYFSITELWKHATPTDNEYKNLAIAKARRMASELNTMYDQMARSLFFIPAAHRFVIKGETIASAAFWVTKKRYAMIKVYDLEADIDLDNKFAVKGLDVVRSSFPAAFRAFMKKVLIDILNNAPKSELDTDILEFFDKLPFLPIQDIARNTAVKNVTKHLMEDQKLGQFALRTPAHVKAAITHNLLLVQWNQNTQYTPITDGAKIKWVYLSQNPYRIQSVAFFGSDEDSPLIVKLVEEFIDYERIFEKEFSHKLSDFYEAMGWGMIPTEVNQNAEKFFAF